MPTNPLESDVHVSAPLTNFSIFWQQQQDMFVGMDAMPNTPVEKQFDQYFVWNRLDLMRDEFQERADGTKAQEASVRLSSDNYTAVNYALRMKITDRQRRNADSQVNLERSKTSALMEKAMIRRDNEWVATFLQANVWGDGAGSGDTNGSNWSTTGDPILDLRTAIRTVHGRSGQRPNKVVFTRLAWDLLLENDNVLSRIEGGVTPAQPAVVQRTLIAALLELEVVQVLNGVQNSATQPDTDSTAFIAGGAEALVYHAPQTLAPETPTAGAQFSWTGFLGATPSGIRILRYRDQEIQSDWIEAEMAFDFKVTAPEIGQRLFSLDA